MTVDAQLTALEQERQVHLPSPTACPIILAFGATLGVAGLVTNPVITVFGIVFVIFGCVGWFRQVLPHESLETVPVYVHPEAIATIHKHVEHIWVSERHRTHLPVETYPVTAGIKGGIAGGMAMVVPALIYGLIAQHSI